MSDHGFLPCIIVIDALDECKRSNTTSTTLFALSKFADRILPSVFHNQSAVRKVLRGISQETG